MKTQTPPKPVTPAARQKFPTKIIVIGLVVVAFLAAAACVWLNQLYVLASLKAYLNDLRDAASAFTQIVGLLLLSGLIFMLVVWLGKKEGTIVLPFQNTTGEEKYDGRAISDSLVAELQRIRQIHLTKIEGVELKTESVTLPAWKPSTEDVSSSIADIGAIGIGDTTVSVGRVMITLKRMWPLGDPGSVITGSIQKYGLVYRLVARLEDRSGIRTWTISRVLADNKELTELIRDLAYDMVEDLSPQITAPWEAFKSFTEAINDYSLYNHTHAPQDLERAEQQCLAAYQHDRTYAKLSGLFYNFGVEESNRNEYAKALQMLEPATQLQSDDAQAFFSLGYAYGELQRHAEAIAAYRRVIEIDPESAYAHNNLGVIYLNQGRADKAKTAFQRAIELDAKIAYPHNGLGNVYYTLGQTDEAIAEYKKAIELDPESAAPYDGLGNVYHDLGRTDEAIAAFRRAIALDPKYAPSYTGLGTVCRALGRTDEAIVEYQRAIELDPNLGTVRSCLVACYRKLGREVEAAEEEKIARTLIDKANEYNRACFEAICGDASDALALLKVALEKKQASLASARRDPDFDNIRTDPRFKALVGEAEATPATNANG